MTETLNAADYPRGGWPEGAVYVGRGTAWGNPYRVGYGVTREDAIQRFRAYAERMIRLTPDWLEPLRGKSLVCHCAPLPCHADVLREIAG